LEIDSTTWQVSSSPNQNIFRITNFYASVQAASLNCGSLFSGSNIIKIFVNFNAPVSNLVGQQ